MMMNLVHSFIVHEEQHLDFGCYNIIHKPKSQKIQIQKENWRL